MIRCHACSEAQFLNQSFWLSPPYKRLRRMRTARRRCQAVVTRDIVPHYGQWHSLLIPELLWDNTRRVLNCWSRRQSCCIIVLEISRFFLTHFTVLGLRNFRTCTLGDFDTVWHALVEVYINATGE